MTEPKQVNVDVRKDGILWLINRSVFHPRGFALAYNESTREFTLLGNGDEPYYYEQINEDELFRAVETLFAKVRVLDE